MTTVALIADLHANAPALEAVLRDLERNPADAIWCAGDLVGYNSYARETLELVREARVHPVHGNHDLMVAGRLPTTGLGPRGRRGIEWARATLSHEDRDWLAALPSVLRVADGVICMHSMLGDVQRRLDRQDDFREQAEIIREFDPAVRVCITAHTHVPGAVRVAPDGVVETHRSQRVFLVPEGVWFVNPGSVGEPRDGDTRASYAVLDLSTRVVLYHRARYSRMRVVRMNALRLPPLAVEPSNTLAQLRGAAARLIQRFS